LAVPVANDLMAAAAEAGQLLDVQGGQARRRVPGCNSARLLSLLQVLASCEDQRTSAPIAIGALLLSSQRPACISHSRPAKSSPGVIWARE
jgi:hypothetical protein